MKKTLLMLALVAGITSFAQNAQAELITINIGSSPGFNIYGIGGGVSDGGFREIVGFPISGNALYLYNDYFGETTGVASSGLAFATGATAATPVKFSLGATIDSGSTYMANTTASFFKYSDTVSQDFEPGSYMGFQTAQGNYGWLQVTWTASTPSSSEEFRILSGAYESRPNVAVLAGATAPIPEPGTWAAMAIFAVGAAFAGWRRRNSAKVPA